MTSKTQAARLPRFGLAPDSTLGRFLRWWTGELAALMPQWLRQSGADIADALLIEVAPHSIILRRWQQDGLSELGRLDLQAGDHAAHSIAFRAMFNKVHKRGERIALWLPDTQCLIKQVELPLAAAENLRQVLGFEMDRLTPFRADQVYFDYRVSQQDNQKNRIAVKLVAATRASVDGALEMLARWGAPAQSVYVVDASSPDREIIDLMPSEHQVADSSGLLGINLALLLLTLLLALAALLIPIWQKRQVSMALISVVDEAKQQAMATDALRREQEKLAAEYNFVLNKKQETPSVVAVLDELSRLLPDDTWVQQLSLKGRELQMQGETGSSSRLVALFEHSGMLHNANFRSPLTKGSTPNSERYQLVVEVRSALSAASAVAAPASAVPSVPAGSATKAGQPSLAQSGVAPGKPMPAVPPAPQPHRSGTPKAQAQLPARTARANPAQSATKAQRQQENQARRQRWNEQMQQVQRALSAQDAPRKAGGGS